MTRTVQLEVLNELGLHARPASEFVRRAQRFPTTTIRIRYRDELFSATSILEVLTANLDQGAIFTLEAEGQDADQALESLGALMIEFRKQEAGERPKR